MASQGVDGNACGKTPKEGAAKLNLVAAARAGSWEGLWRRNQCQPGAGGGKRAEPPWDVASIRSGLAQSRE